MSLRVVGLSYNETGSANLWPWTLIVCDGVDDLPSVALVEDMQAYVFEDEQYYVVNADGDWEVDADPQLYYATPVDLDALERRVLAIEEQQLIEQLDREAASRGKRTYEEVSFNDRRGAAVRGRR